MLQLSVGLFFDVPTDLFHLSCELVKSQSQ